MEAVEAAQAQVQEVAASHQGGCDTFFADVDTLCRQAADYLAELSKHVRDAIRICSQTCMHAGYPPTLPAGRATRRMHRSCAWRG